PHPVPSGSGARDFAERRNKAIAPYGPEIGAHSVSVNFLGYHCGGGISFSTWIAATSSEPSGSFGAPATNTFKPGLRSSLVPGTVVAMMVFGVTTIFFSSSGLPWTLYLTVSTWPSTPATEVCNGPLVMKLFG